MPATYAELEQRARAQLADVQNDPQARYRLRERYYEQYGFGGAADPFGDGTSELAFLRWMIERGVLSPTTGSAWWRAVDDTFVLASQLGGMVHEAKLPLAEVPDARVRAWVEYIEDPTGASWYRAHNMSIVQGYLDHRELARRETEAEQLFMNEVLYRVLYAEGLILGVEMGRLGQELADPCGPAVAILTHIPDFYPRHYPLTAADVVHVRHLGFGLEEDLVRLLDQLMILPQIEQLYALVSLEIAQPDLPRLIKEGRPIYPDLTPKPEPPKQRAKIAILGGGIAGLTAAWELTRSPDWEREYEITIYQLGWRVGGKTATGRGPFDRVEEHGIHILQGWYDNTFQLIQDVYRERRDRGLAPRSPFQKWQQAFDRNDSTIITEWVPELGRWMHWPLIFPPNDAEPGDGPPLSMWQILRKLAGIVLELILGSPYQKGQHGIAQWILDQFFPPQGEDPNTKPGLIHRVLFDVKQWVHHGLDDLERAFFDRAHAMLDVLEQPAHAHHGEALDGLIAILEHATAWFEKELARLERFDFGIYRDLILVELAIANLRGLIRDVWTPETGRFEFARIDHLDYRDWIASHGASDRVLASGVVRFFYTGTFSNFVGGNGDGGRIAAGTALRFVMQSVGYKGSFVWQMKAGTGDTVIMPIYEVLRARGVRFEFFAEVRDVVPSPDGAIDAIDIGRQVTLQVPEYEPTIHVGDVRAWPSEPRYAQIDPEQAKRLREGHVDLESPWAAWTPVAHQKLVRGRDFDHAILAIPIAALPHACRSVVDANPRWQRMIAGVPTTATMSMQLWLTPSLRELGFDPADWGLASHDEAPNVVTYASPMYSWLDSSLVLWTERWPAEASPQFVAYFTGSMQDPPHIPPFTDHAYPEQQREALAILMRQWLRDRMAYFWPSGATREFPEGLDPSLLTCGDPHASAAEKYAAQYFRANVDPWARYTLSTPDSAKHRLRTDQSGYSNLFLAGDWIDFGMNVGYIEGALTSGAQAARALRRRLELPAVPSTFRDLDPGAV